MLGDQEPPAFQRMGRAPPERSCAAPLEQRSAQALEALIERSRMRLEALAAIGDVLAAKVSNSASAVQPNPSVTFIELDQAVGAWLIEWRRRLVEAEEMHRVSSLRKTAKRDDED